MFPLSRYKKGLINYQIRNRTIHKTILNNKSGWYNSDYSKRKKIIITGGASEAQTNYQLKLIITYMAAMQSDFDNLRFTKKDGITLIDAWLENKVNNTAADIWVEFPTTPINTVKQNN